MSAFDGIKNLVHEDNAGKESDMLSEDEYESYEDVLVSVINIIVIIALHIVELPYYRSYYQILT